MKTKEKTKTPYEVALDEARQRHSKWAASLKGLAEEDLKAEGKREIVRIFTETACGSTFFYAIGLALTLLQNKAPGAENIAGNIKTWIILPPEQLQDFLYLEEVLTTVGKRGGTPEKAFQEIWGNTYTDLQIPSISITNALDTYLETLQCSAENN